MIHGWALAIQTAPTLEPLKTSEVKAHLRKDTTDEDGLINALIATARRVAEYHTRRALITQTWDLQLDDWPRNEEIEIPLPPLQSVPSTGITYKTTGGTVKTYGSTNYIVDTKSEPGRVALKDAADWPSTELQAIAGVNIRFVAGYGSTYASVPQTIKQAMKLMIGHWFENREQVVIGSITNEIPLGAKALLDMERVMTFW